MLVTMSESSSTAVRTSSCAAGETAVAVAAAAESSADAWSDTVVTNCARIDKVVLETDKGFGQFA
jgi:hypothetical protein